MSSSDALPSLRAIAAPNATDRELEGVIVDAPSPFNVRYDPRGAEASIVDLGDIGEDAGGIWVARHPEMLVLDDPTLWDPVSRYRRGIVELTSDDDERLSAFEAEAALTIWAAHQRAVVARSRSS